MAIEGPITASYILHSTNAKPDVIGIAYSDLLKRYDNDVDTQLAIGANIVHNFNPKSKINSSVKENYIDNKSTLKAMPIEDQAILSHIITTYNKDNDRYNKKSYAKELTAINFLNPCIRSLCLL